MVLVEVARKAYLASLVPVIVNTILNEHQLVADIVAFVNKGDFPRSRLGEKQRGKILASWVTSKMRTMAQFGIRDGDAGLSDVTEAAEPRQSSSIRNSGVVSGSVRNMEPAPQILEQQELEQQHQNAPFPHTPMAELPTQPYSSSINDLTTSGDGSTNRSDDTPTGPKAGHFELPANPSHKSEENIDPPATSSQRQNYTTNLTNSGNSSDALPPPVGPKPTMAPQLPPLPAVDGREGDLWTLPSQRAYEDLLLKHPAADDEDDWSQEALMHMNLARR